MLRHHDHRSFTIRAPNFWSCHGIWKSIIDTTNDRESLEVTCRELLRLTEIVTLSVKPRIEIPHVILKTTEEVVEARRLFARWYASGTKSQVSPEIEESNASHQHFIEVLSRIRTLLSGAHSKQAGPTSGQSKQAKKNASRKDAQPPLNPFTLLPSKEPPKSSDQSQRETSTCNPGKAHSSFELETPKDETPFMLWCYLEGLGDIRKHFRVIVDYLQNGCLSRTNACILMDAAFSMMRSRHEDFSTRFTQFDDHCKIFDYRNIVIFTQAQLITIYSNRSKADVDMSGSAFHMGDLLGIIGTKTLESWLRWMCSDSQDPDKTTSLLVYTHDFSAALWKVSDEVERLVIYQVNERGMLSELIRGQIPPEFNALEFRIGDEFMKGLQEIYGDES